MDHSLRNGSYEQPKALLANDTHLLPCEQRLVVANCRHTCSCIVPPSALVGGSQTAAAAGFGALSGNFGGLLAVLAATPGGLMVAFVDLLAAMPTPPALTRLLPAALVEGRVGVGLFCSRGGTTQVQQTGSAEPALDVDSTASFASRRVAKDTKAQQLAGCTVVISTGSPYLRSCCRNLSSSCTNGDWTKTRVDSMRTSA